MTNLKDNLNFKLIKKITKEMHLSRIMVGILILGVFFSSIITFARPRIVSRVFYKAILIKWEKRN